MKDDIISLKMTEDITQTYLWQITSVAGWRDAELMGRQQFFYLGFWYIQITVERLVIFGIFSLVCW